jgi:hypothetical protein
MRNEELGGRNSRYGERGWQSDPGPAACWPSFQLRGRHARMPGLPQLDDRGASLRRACPHLWLTGKTTRCKLRTFSRRILASSSWRARCGSNASAELRCRARRNPCSNSHAPVTCHFVSDAASSRGFVQGPHVRNCEAQPDLQALV